MFIVVRINIRSLQIIIRWNYITCIVIDIHFRIQRKKTANQSFRILFIPEIDACPIADKRNLRQLFFRQAYIIVKYAVFGNKFYPNLSVLVP